MFMLLYALATSLLIVGVLWAEYRINGYRADNALTRAWDACEEWHLRRLSRQRVLEAAE